jgi:catechol 2,3-dioxygenase-like lactoylglutathione lyase family enzyme
MSIPQRMSLVTLGARDFPRLRDFYLGLGWTPGIQTDDFCSFLVGGVVLGIYPVAQLGKEAHAEPPAGGTWSGWTLAQNVATREEVDGMYAQWVAAGATPIAEPVDHPYGPRTGYVADPEGNRWEIAWANGLEWDARGAVTKFFPT